VQKNPSPLPAERNDGGTISLVSPGPDQNVNIKTRLCAAQSGHARSRRAKDIALPPRGLMAVEANSGGHS